MHGCRLEKIGPVPANPEINQPGSFSLIFKPQNPQNALFYSLWPETAPSLRSCWNPTRHKGCAELGGKHTTWVGESWTSHPDNGLKWRCIQPHSSVSAHVHRYALPCDKKVHTCIAMRCRVTQRTTRRDNAYASRTLLSWIELIQETMTLSWSPILPISAERGQVILSRNSKTQVAW